VKAGLTGVALALVASLVRAESDFSALTPQERAIFHAEIRAVLLANPEIAAPKPVALGYGDDIARDLNLIAAHAEALFDPSLAGFGRLGASQRIALFIGPECSDCDRAIADLKALASTYDMRVTVHDIEPQNRLAQNIGVDTLPFYVFPKMMLRGHMPAVVLERYLTNRTGQ